MFQTVQTDTTAFFPSNFRVQVSPKSQRKRSFYTQEEDIEIKPSTELIPDEYEHSTNNNVLLHIFKTSLEDYIAADLIETLQKIDYNVDYKTHVHDLNEEKQFLQDLENIKQESKDKNALLLVFIGFFDPNEEHGTLLMMNQKQSVSMKSVWNMFASNNCPELKNKPKMFLFCTSPEPPGAAIQTDSIRHREIEFNKVYDFPVESDLLIIYNQINEMMSSQKDAFFTRLCENIENYSKKYDVIDLVSYLHGDCRYSPVVVSTLTRKFYLTPSTDREHYLALNENQSFLEESLDKIHKDLEKLAEIQKKKKDKKFSFPSFRAKSEDKPKVTKKSQEKPKNVQKPVQAKPQRPTGSKATSGPPSPKNKPGLGRSRNPSETDSSVTKNRGPWKL